SAMKSEFVGAISHELRSPLNVMLGYLEMTLDGAFGPIGSDAADALRRARQQSLALLEMITALLDLNRLEAGPPPGPRPPGARRPGEGRRGGGGGWVEEMGGELADSWRGSEVELRVIVAPGLPLIETDAGKLRTVVRNLLHNACKFTERGRVTLAADTTPTGD